MVTTYLKNVYENKRVLLTGHTGFKGSWMLVALENLSAIVKGYALKAEKNNSLYHLINGNKLCDSVIADIRNYKKLRKEILNFSPDFIFHFAAQAIVRTSYDIPHETFEVNSTGTVNLLEAVRTIGKPCYIVIVTTDKVYENKETIIPYKETDSLGGSDPYSSSKACAEIITSSYRASFFQSYKYDFHKVCLATARSGNVIGGGDWAKDRIIPDLVRAYTNKQPLIVRNPQSIRPWQHVLEPVYGYLLLGARMTENPILFADAFNFGPEPDDELTVEELVKLASSNLKKMKFQINEINDGPHEMKVLKLNNQKAKSILKWRPKLNSKEAIELTMEWYKKYSDDPYAITQKQTRDFMLI